MKIMKKIGNWEKIQKLGKNLEILEKFSNLEKIWKFEKHLEKSGKFGCLEQNWTLGNNLDKFRNSQKFWKLKIFLKFGKNLEIWKKMRNLYKKKEKEKLDFGK